MFFDSTAYAVFLTLITLAYWRLSFRGQNRFLLAEWFTPRVAEALLRSLGGDAAPPSPEAIAREEQGAAP